jgi:hypothetical protein
MGPRNHYTDALDAYDRGWDRARTKAVANAYGQTGEARYDALSRLGMTQEAETGAKADEARAGRLRGGNVRAAIAAGNFDEAQRAAEGDTELMAGVGEEQKRQAAEALAQAHVMQGVFTRLAAIPDPAEQQAAFQRALPTLQRMNIKGLEKVEFGQEAMAQQAEAMGLAQERVKEQFFNTTEGVVAVNPETGAGRLVHEVKRPPPTGYAWDEKGGLMAIPGGPADPKQAGTLAGAKRAPKAAGGGGGRIPAPPPGFVMEK